MPTQAKVYRFTQTVCHAPLADREYRAGTQDTLADWDARARAWALAAGLIEEIAPAAGDVWVSPAPLSPTIDTAGKED